MAARLLSRVSFLFRATVQQNITGKVPKNISLFPRAPVQQNITIKALENIQVSYLSRIDPTSAGEESQYERASQSGRGVFLMVGGFALSSLNSETPKKSDEEVKRSSEKENLRDERGRFARTQPKPNGNLERRTRGIREWRAKRKLEFDRTEESPPPKRETRMSQKQAQKEEYIPHGCRIVDLDVLRNGLQSCQCCKSGETEKKGLLKL
ncbi:hypothetical protein OS493_000187 [Desmophyllum pertusum]|uniref:Uncharacterized protein n=1 Tax=Desmophyllum pertusum TaxID=174260 RepID=A0A9X0DDU9_9CNID|nr:hypothetical protein OS493_000187 [Desmophyllum pertusum]